MLLELRSFLLLNDEDSQEMVFSLEYMGIWEKEGTPGTRSLLRRSVKESEFKCHIGTEYHGVVAVEIARSIGSVAC